MPKFCAKMGPTAAKNNVREPFINYIRVILTIFDPTPSPCKNMLDFLTPSFLSKILPKVEYYRMTSPNLRPEVYVYRMQLESWTI